MNATARSFTTRAVRAIPAFVRAHDAAVDLGRRAREGASDRLHAARHAARRTRRAAEQRVDDTRVVIRRNPLRSVAIAALAGAFAGALTTLVTRRRRANRT